MPLWVSSKPRKSIQKYDIQLVGDRGVGKESILNRLVNNDYPYIYLDKRVTKTRRTYDDKLCIIKFHKSHLGLYGDYRQSRPLTQRCDGVFMVYDVCDRRSFRSLDGHWRNLRGRKGAIIRLVGNKIDEEGSRTVSVNEGKKRGEEWGVTFSECSAKTGEGVEEALGDLVRSIMAMKIEEERKENTLEEDELKGIREEFAEFFKRLARGEGLR